jgi:uncharacterized protein (DUF849 family)
MAHKVIIEVRLNEYARRDANPHVPWTPAEIAADARECREAGAAIAHFHARRPDGSPALEYEPYREVVAALRDGTDMLIHPTLGAMTATGNAVERIAHVMRLVEAGLTPDLAPIDMVSSNVDMIEPESGAFLSEEGVYVNTVRTLRHFSERFRDAGIKPYAQVWNVPSLRYTLAFARAGLLAEPLFLSFALTEGGAISGHPGTPAGLRAFLDFLPGDLPVHWSAVLFGGNMLPLIGMIAAEGGHISIGLGDYPYPELGQPTNAGLIARVADLVRACGATVATPAEARQMLGIGRRR